MTEQERVLKYKNYPEGSVGRQVYDSIILPFSEYLKKYYANPDLSTWEKWFLKYIEPAFDKNRYGEMIKSFGYVSINKHDFNTQYKVYTVLKNNLKLDDELRKFIGFMGGNGFFREYNIDVNQWFDMSNWNNPYHEKDNKKTINEILEYEEGINMLKISLPHLDYWRR